MTNKSLKALVITSRVTFAPDNYNQLIAGLAACPQVAGLLVLDNRKLSIIVKSLVIMYHGANRLGTSLLLNFIGKYERRRKLSYRAMNKPIWMVKCLNCEDTLRIIKDNKFDILINARTRIIFKQKLIESTRFGAINIHHGILPEQRGTMCDLWSLSNNEACGFTIHKISEKIDDGDIIKVVYVSDGLENNYMKYLKTSTNEELKAVRDFLGNIEATGTITTTPNIRSANAPYRRDPTSSDIKQFKLSELQL